MCEIDSFSVFLCGLSYLWIFRWRPLLDDLTDVPLVPSLSLDGYRSIDNLYNSSSRLGLCTTLGHIIFSDVPY